MFTVQVPSLSGPFVQWFASQFCPSLLDAKSFFKISCPVIICLLRCTGLYLKKIKNTPPPEKKPKNEIRIWIIWQYYDIFKYLGDFWDTLYFQCTMYENIILPWIHYLQVFQYSYILICLHIFSCIITFII